MQFSFNRLILLAAAPVVASCSHQSDGNENGQRPNIILFMVDDMGWEDTSLPFWTKRTFLNDRYCTPNMELLASQGMMFTQAYASSVSSPSRCSLMTGCNAARHRVTNWTLEKDKSQDLQSEEISCPEWNCNGICQEKGVEKTFYAKSFVEILRENGYRTIHVGKAHFGAIGTPGETPLHFGFDVNIAGHAAGGPASYLGEKNYGHKDDGTPWSLFATPGLEDYWGTNTFLTESLTQEAIKAMDSALLMEKPFYLYLSHYAVHVPWNIDKRYYQKYRDLGLSMMHSAYASLIEGMDKSLGDVMHYLEDKGIADNTIILFMSDNGGLASEINLNEEDLWKANYPLKSGKGSVYEGGVREPMIVKWPGKVEAGMRCDDYLIIEDFYPTILEMAQIDGYQVPQPIDGISFMPMLLQKGKSPADNRDLFWNHPNIWSDNGVGLNLYCAVRSGDWKLVYFYKTGKKELYNIKEDIREGHDLSENYPKIVKKLSGKLGRYLRSVDAQRPTFKATGEACPWPDEI